MGETGLARQDHDDTADTARLKAMGYAPQLSRNMGRFSNFAISFSIIGILSGGVNSLAQATSGAGGAAIGLGWPVGAACALVFAACMAQIASSFPAAGGLYHWSSILGGRFWGWLTAWLNLIGLVTVLAAINVGTFGFFVGAFGPLLHVEAGYGTQLAFVAGITAVQALVNHLGIRATSRLTDASGYLILGTSIALTAALLWFGPGHHLAGLPWARLWTFANYSGPAGGGVWPATGSVAQLMLLGLLLPIYVLTGYDASAHTAEETRNAALNAPRGIISSVIWASLFAWLFSCAFVLAVPDMDQAAHQGWNVFFWVMQSVLPDGVRYALYGLILMAQLLCGLATVTSVSRMIFAFARDDGLPASGLLKRVSPRFLSPVAAIWTGAVLSVAFTVYADGYAVVVSVTSILLYLSYAMPIAAGLFAYRRRWTEMGPWDMGPAFRLLAVLSILLTVGIFLIGIQPPNGQALTVLLAVFALTAVLWLAVERRRFVGPPRILD